MSATGALNQYDWAKSWLDTDDILSALVSAGVWDGRSNKMAAHAVTSFASNIIGRQLQMMLQGTSAPWFMYSKELDRVFLSAIIDTIATRWLVAMNSPMWSTYQKALVVHFLSTMIGRKIQGFSASA